MAQPEHFDVLVLGSGQGGQLIAWNLAHGRRRAALVERRWIGGSCPNIACMPSKTELWSARIAHLARHGQSVGVSTAGVTIDMPTVLRRKRAMVRHEVELHTQNFTASDAELIVGNGRFVAPKTLEVTLDDGARVLSGDQVFLNLGTHPAIPAIAGLKETQPLTHIEALELDYVPDHLIVLGGGYVGIEMAQAFQRFGSGVTIIQTEPRLLSREDFGVAVEMQCILGDEGIHILTGTEVLSVRGRSGDKITLAVRTPSGEQELEGSDLLIATGRVPNTAGIGLEEAGVTLDARGYICVNERLETTAPGVWAIGECAGSPYFTHVSVDDFRIIKDSLAGGSRTTRDRLVPYCLFTDPPLAHVGLTERDEEARGIAVRVAQLPVSAVLRTHTTDETRGFMKAVIGDDDRIRGFTMIGAEAGEVMAAVQTAMLAELPFQQLRDAVIAHLTMAEGPGAATGERTAALGNELISESTLVDAAIGVAQFGDVTMTSKLSGKIALVTGGSAGIGLGIAKRFSEEGARVFVVGRRQSQLDQAVTTIGGGAAAIQGDISNLGDLDRIYATVEAQAGHIDVLAVNAGVYEFGKLGEITEEQFDRTFNTDVRGVLFTVQKALPLLATGSSVILTGSMVSIKGFAACSVYNASKAAVRSFARTWIVDLKGRDIRVNVLSPGYTDTPGLSQFVTDEEKAAMIASVPLGRIGTPNDLGKAAVFLASDDSAYVTGIELFVDGGAAQI